MKSNKPKKLNSLNAGDVIFNSANYFFFILFTLLCVFPFYYLFINTISSNDLVQKGLINFVPRGFHLKNYTSILTSNTDLLRAFIVTLSRTLIGTCLTVMASAFIGYIMTKK